MLTDEIREQLFALQDEEYGKFQSKLIPGIPQETVIGVRTPILRKMAAQLSKREDLSDFFEDLPHKYFEENQLHGFLIEKLKNPENCLRELEHFLPYVDNWATCDQIGIKPLKKDLALLAEKAKEWLSSDRVYTIRFGIKCLMDSFLEDAFETNYLVYVANVKNNDYYVKMMVAWYFATALAKQYDASIPFLEEKKLEEWIHKKTIQKAVESFRISEEKKQYLKTLR